jgi:hypothetical protein
MRTNTTYGRRVSQRGGVGGSGARMEDGPPWMICGAGGGGGGERPSPKLHAAGLRRLTVGTVRSGDGTTVKLGGGVDGGDFGTASCSF